MQQVKEVKLKTENYVLNCRIDSTSILEKEIVCESRLVGSDVHNTAKCHSLPVAYHGLFGVWP